MDSTQILLIFLISFPYMIFTEIHESKQKFFPNLRRHQVVGVAGRFVVNRDDLEHVLQTRKQQDGACGKDVKLQLPKSLPHSAYNESSKGEVMMFYVTATDHTLADELPSCLKAHVDVSYKHLLVAIPVIFGKRDEHGLLFLRSFTNSTRKVPVPYSTSSSEVTHVDSIEEEDDGNVTLRLGDDEMIIRVQGKDQAGNKRSVGDDFDEVTGKVIPVTNYPSSFDWDCKYFGSEISFCQAINEVRCELAAVGGDVCALISTSVSDRSPATMTIFRLTGIYQRMFPYLAETVPSNSFEAETVNREHGTGIKYPCLTL